METSTKIKNKKNTPMEYGSMECGHPTNIYLSIFFFLKDTERYLKMFLSNIFQNSSNMKLSKIFDLVYDFKPTK